VKRNLLLLALALCPVTPAQISGTAPSPPQQPLKPGVKEVQVPFASLKPIATFKVGKSADWIVVTDDAVWISATEPYSVQRIDPATNKVVANVQLPGEACSDLAIGFGSLWVPVCGKNPSPLRINAVTNKITATLPLTPADSEGGITVSGDSVWIVADKNGTLSRIDPATNTVRQKIAIPPGSYNPLFGDGIIWITGFETSVLTAVDANSGEVLASIPVGPKPRFLTVGGNSVWTLNQGDGTISRVDEKSRKLTVTIVAGIPGSGGDICYGANSVWATVFDVPLTQIDAKTNKVVRQWVGPGGDAIRFSHDAIWLADYHQGLLSRFPDESVQGAMHPPAQ
jgi:virginiamycin B lyase